AFRRESFNSWVISENLSGVLMTRGEIRIRSSVRVAVLVVRPKGLPIIGISERKGTPFLPRVFESRMRPAMATISPSLTASVVATLDLLKLRAEVTPTGTDAPGELTS